MTEDPDGYDWNRDQHPVEKNFASHLARITLIVFLLTFTAARVLVWLIMARTIPDFFLHLGGTHVHHLNYGIFILSGVCGYSLFFRPTGKILEICAALYGVGLALTFDEFGMWLHLGGSYWQRASYDACVVVAAILALIVFASHIKKFRSLHKGMILILILIIGLFAWMLVKSLKYAQTHIQPHLLKIEKSGPH